MKTFRKICAAVILVFVLITAVLNVYLRDSDDKNRGVYKVEAKRLADEITETGTYDLKKYPHITGIFTEEDGDLYDAEKPYVIIEADGKLYRAEYYIESSDGMIIAVNCALAVVFIVTLLLLFYIRRKILQPFGRINSVPQELAKGNLAVELPEEKSRFFGKFTWGVNLLREKIENDRKKELAMQRDKKLLLLSLSHDIKTPLSAIKLNAKALAKGIYKDENKRRDAAESINKRADEIENFLSQITTAASEDFMTFEVKPGEVFLADVINKIDARYAPQLSVTGTQFDIGEYRNCLLSCDEDRLAECLQNLIENAIKYGDGKRIALSFDRVDGCELITVSNTGCTLEPEELTQIFSSFQRGKNAENKPGNGLGLFICRKIMTLMGGEIYAEIKDGCFNATLVVKLC